MAGIETMRAADAAPRAESDAVAAGEEEERERRDFRVLDEEERNPRWKARVLGNGLRVLEGEGAMDGENAEAAAICGKSAGAKKKW